VGVVTTREKAEKRGKLRRRQKSSLVMIHNEERSYERLKKKFGV